MCDISNNIFTFAVIYGGFINIFAYISYQRKIIIVRFLHTLARALCTAADDCAATPRAILAVALVL